MKFLKNVFLMILCTFLYACNEKAGPEETLRKFINYRFEGGQSKSKIISMTGGLLKEKIEKMKESDFEKFKDTSSLRKRKLIINVKNCAISTKCFITYTLAYKEVEKGKKLMDIEVKKIAELNSPEEGIWKITDINNIKSFMDSKVELKIQSN